MYEKQADGSVKVSFLSKPAMGPAYSADKICLGSLPLTPDWPGEAVLSSTVVLIPGKT